VTLNVKPELGVEIVESSSLSDLKDTTAAAHNTANKLAEHGLEITPTKEDKENAAKLVSAYAENPEKTSKKITVKRAAALTPASLIVTDKILKEFGRSVVESSVQIRHLVTNKLLLESENPDPRVRMRALELLGKISDVALFAEKSEVTITHQSTDDLRDKLKTKLEKLVVGEAIEDAVIIDVAEELGLDEPKNKEEYDD
tara:strand:- start:622 stop:1221 length:600 start_codon:yes stop_codon:yes gene_type:complete